MIRRTVFRNCVICRKEYLSSSWHVEHGTMLTCSRKCGYKIVSQKLMGSNNGMWEGESVGYITLHHWVNRRKPKPEYCENCGQREPYDLANISQEYKRDIHDYKWLCRKCHMIEDGRLAQLLLNRGRPEQDPITGRFIGAGLKDTEND